MAEDGGEPAAKRAKTEEKSAEYSELRAGETWQYHPSSANPQQSDTTGPEDLKVISFNIERGLNAGPITAWLKEQRADVLLLQEVDVGCERTGWRNVVKDLADSLCMHAVYAVEFEELASPLRNARRAGGGSHGNAVLSRFPFAAAGAFVFKNQPFNWETHGSSLGQPRKGARCCVWADLQVRSGVAPLRVYSAHLENFTGIVGRLQQMAEVLKHAAAEVQLPQPCIIGGDLNTLMHGMLRFLPFFYPTTDWLRFKTFGVSEAEWWEQNVFKSPSGELARSWVGDASLDCLKDAHPEDWIDPFDKKTEITRVGTLGLWEAKLDWILARNLSCTSKAIGPDGLSDHRAVIASYQLTI